MNLQQVYLLFSLFRLPRVLGGSYCSNFDIKVIIYLYAVFVQIFTWIMTVVGGGEAQLDMPSVQRMTSAFEKTAFSLFYCF